jgi:hypothetical protein
MSIFRKGTLPGWAGDAGSFFKSPFEKGGFRGISSAYKNPTCIVSQMYLAKILPPLGKVFVGAVREPPLH